MRIFHSRAVAAAVAAAAFVLVSPAAHADEPDDDDDGPTTFSVWTDPLLNPDPLVSDQTEGTNTAATCSYEQTVLTGPNPAPSVPSHQLVYFVPSDVTPNKDMDVPRSCSDGTVDYTNLARSSRNFATWLDARGAGINFRTLTADYNHNYTGNTYATRSVRRLVSTDSLATWNSRPMYQVVNGVKTSPRHTAMKSEMEQRGFEVTSTRYVVMMHANASSIPCPNDPLQNCDVLGVAQDRYALSIRVFADNTRVLRYGCGSAGDVVQAHETAHLVYPHHVTDATQDLLYQSLPSRKFTSSPSVHWDYNRDDYHSTVTSSVYVQGKGLAGSYFTC